MAPMGLKAPSIMTFMAAIVLTVTVLIMTLFGAEIPLLNGHEFWVLFSSQLLLIFGRMVRGL